MENRKRFRQNLGYFKRILKLIFKVNWIKTFYINYFNFPFFQALKFPIICYGKINIYSLKGKIIIKDKLRTGIVQIGKDIDNMPISALPVRLRLENDLIFNGPSIISGGANIAVGKNGIIELGKFSRICSGVYLKAVKKIKIGDFSWITAESIVMDSDIHYIKNVETGEVKKNTKEIIIGNYCWVVMRSVISKGTILPDYTIVARNSFVNKDFSKTDFKGIFLAGSPAKIVANSLQYLPFMQREGELNAFFDDNPQIEKIFISEGLENYSKDQHLDFNLV